MPQWSRRSYTEDGAPLVEDGFYYSSDNNDEWLDEEGLKEMIADSCTDHGANGTSTTLDLNTLKDLLMNASADNEDQNIDFELLEKLIKKSKVA